jgi:predicted unusual protein kinase regulating ubiquinone biosynthesis (AarF/ABC1/UbiB family)
MCSVPDATASSDSHDAPPEGDGIGQGRLRRAAPLAALSVHTAGEALALGLRKRLTSADAAEFHERTAERYAELLGSSKGALMKVGQMLSFVPAGAVIPAELQAIYQAAFARLRADAPPMAPGLTRETLERELGRRTESAYEQFDWTPLAAASVGQVHAARLHDGRPVAVKIQYPGVAAAIDADLRNHELIATFLDLAAGLSPKRMTFDIRSAAREMSARITEELDYRLEAANQTQFADIYRGHPFIHVPAVIGELSTRRVLTQELVLGKSWNEALTAEQQLRDSWAEAIHRFGYGSYDRFCLFNADPHPGNYLFHDDGSVSFLDFGCVKRLQRDQVETMDSILRACWRDDVLGTWRASVEAGFWRSSDPVTADEVFAYWRDDWAMLWADERFTVTPAYVTRWIARRFSPNGPSANAVRHASVPPELTLIGRMEIGVASLIAQLHASNHWGRMAAERFGRVAPFTAMGKLDHAFFAERQAADSPPDEGR